VAKSWENSGKKKSLEFVGFITLDSRTPKKLTTPYFWNQKRGDPKKKKTAPKSKKKETQIWTWIIDAIALQTECAVSATRKGIYYRKKRVWRFGPK